MKEKREKRKEQHPDASPLAGMCNGACSTPNASGISSNLGGDGADSCSIPNAVEISNANDAEANDDRVSQTVSNNSRHTIAE